MPGPKPFANEKPKNLKLSAKHLVESLRPWRWQILAACIFATGSTVLAIFGPKILGNMTTSAITSYMSAGKIDWVPITNSMITLVVLYAISGVLGYFESFVLGRVAARYSQNLRMQILDKINRLPIIYFDRHQFGDTLSRMTNDVDNITSSLQNSLTEMISNITMLIGVAIMMFSISPLLSVIAIIAIPASTFFVAKVAGKAQKYFGRGQATLGKLNSCIEESYSGQSVIKANSHEPASIKEFSEINRSLYDSSWKAQFYSSMAFPITHVFTNLGYVAICIAGGYQAIKGRISIGNIQAFIQYTNQFNRPITQVAQIASTVQLTLAASERVFSFLSETEETPDSITTTRNDNIRGAVEFSHVNFSYKEKPVIRDFSCKIEPGMQVALVGPTGAGKTTIVNLLMRFYDPDSGIISIDGTPTKEMRRADVRQLFGMVLQDTWLFSGTIEENLRYGNPKATHEDIVNVCKQIHIDHLISSLPNGYRTKISEDSDNISAGEKQLLTIARAMIANPPMMIFDEATSNVDTRTEQLIQTAFDKLTDGRTSFVIAHRLSTIRNADLILVLKDGQIIERGNHDELLSQNGFYADLYNSQFAEN